MKSNEKKPHCQRLVTSSFLIFAVFSNIVMAESNREEALGYSIKGDKESPNVLYFVPWKSPSPPSKISIPLPELNSIDVLDRETLLREQLYYKQLKGQAKHTP